MAVLQSDSTQALKRWCLMIKQVSRIAISSDYKGDVAETQQPLPSTSFPSEFLPITPIATAPRLKAPLQLNFTKLTGGGIHCSEELSIELRDSGQDTTKKKNSDWAEQLAFKTEIRQTSTLSKTNLFLDNIYIQNFYQYFP